MVSVCCVGFASLGVVCNELHDCVWMLVCSSFSISVCMFIESKALLIFSATGIVRTRGAIWLNIYATVLFNVCSAVTVECGVSVCVFGMFAVMQGRRLLSSDLAITERRDMGMYEVSSSMSLLGFMCLMFSFS